jgi:hypothetical protein
LEADFEIENIKPDKCRLTKGLQELPAAESATAHTTARAFRRGHLNLTFLADCAQFQIEIIQHT